MSCLACLLSRLGEGVLHQMGVVLGVDGWRGRDSASKKPSFTKISCPSKSVVAVYVVPLWGAESFKGEAPSVTGVCFS